MKKQVEKEEARVSAGAVDKVIDLAFNPSREKIREMTIVDRLQARLFPQLDVINMGRNYLIEVAYYRQSPSLYKKLYKKDIPEIPNLCDELMYRTAQWQKSVGGKNLEKATDISLAEIEGRIDNSYLEEEDQREALKWNRS